jgi:hypothetical protein
VHSVPVFSPLHSPIDCLGTQLLVHVHDVHAGTGRVELDKRSHCAATLSGQSVRTEVRKESRGTASSKKWKKMRTEIMF